jgi:glycine/D-amino acid oxidase-like deaminating enzyme
MVNNKSLAVVGGGIAGTVIAWQAHLRGYKVSLYNHEKKNTPSKVAAGIINPITISRKKAIAKGKDFAQFAWETYRSMPNSETFMNQVPIQVDIKDIKEYNNWVLSSAHENGLVQFETKDKCFVNYSGWIDTKLMLSEKLFEGTIKRVSKRVKDFKKIANSYDTVVLATGFLPQMYLSQLRTDAFRPVLGDILKVSLMENRPFSHLEGAFLIPLTKDTHCLGSTYIREFKDDSPSLERAHQLIEKVRLQGVKVKNLLAYSSSIRPTVYDRFPLVGKLEDNIYSFTGMGSRALLHAPLLAEQLLEHIEGKSSLNKEVDINRARLKSI